MRPVEVTDAEVVEAGQALQATGRRVTGFALRQRLGRGSATRLRDVWDAHQAKAAASHDAPAPELPVEVADTLQAVGTELLGKLASLASELNRGAVRAAELRVAQALQGAAEQRQQADQELADAGQAVEELEAQVVDLSTALDSERARLASAGEQAQRQAVELATVRQRLASAEQAAQQAAEVHAAELASTRAEAVQLRDQVEHLRRDLGEQVAEVRARDQQLLDERTTADARALEWRGQVERLTTDLQAARDEVSALQARGQAAQDQYRAERATAAQAALQQAEKMTAVQAERNQAQSEAATARETAARLEGQVDTLASQNASLMALLRALGGDGVGALAGAGAAGAPTRRKSGGS